MIELLTAAKRMGLYDSLIGELETSQSARLQAAQGLMSIPSKSRRWIGEMEEIAATFKDLGLTPRILEGVADIYRFVGDTTLADQTSREPDPPIDAILDTLAHHLGG